MNLILSAVSRAALAAVLLVAPVMAGDIKWQGDYEGTLASAAAEARVVFVAVNMTGERANERMIADVYTEKKIEELAELTLNIVATNCWQDKASACKAFKPLTPEELRELDVQIRSKVLRPDDQGYVVAPQHVFLNGAGEVLLSVPYELRAEELEWCFHEAFNRIGYSTSLARSAKARAPRRLIDGAVLDSSEESAPLTLEEARELIDSIKRGLRNAERWRALRRLLSVDEEEVADFVRLELRGGGGGGRRGGGRRGGGNERARTRLVRAIGERSPERYWSLLVELLNDPSENVRSEVAVALEQLAAEDSAKEIASAVGKENPPDSLADREKHASRLGVR